MKIKNPAMNTLKHAQSVQDIKLPHDEAFNKTSGYIILPIKLQAIRQPQKKRHEKWIYRLFITYMLDTFYASPTFLYISYRLTQR
jgi:hypothetical protein